MKANEIMTSAKRTFSKVGFGLQKKSPEILVGIGIVGAVASAVLACKATTKAGAIVEESKNSLTDIREAKENGVTKAGESYSEEDHKKDLAIAYVQTGVKFAKLYAPAVMLGAASIASILASHNIMKKRNVALAAAYAAVDKSFKDYRDRVIERFGEQVEKELRYNIKAQEIEETVTDDKGKEKKVKQNVNVADENWDGSDYGPYAKVFDDTHSDWKQDPEMNLFYLRARQAQANDMLKSQGHLFLNEVYDMSVLYSPAERHKIEWAIGSVVSGDSKRLQKFMVLYGAAGTGKSTVLNIIQQLFDGYYSVFDAKALGSSSNAFALEAFKTNPLVAIQHDGDLSRIEDNTRLNSLVSHELMTVNEKFKSTYANRFKAFLFMGTNKPVRITDAKSGLIRRLIDVSPTGDKVEPNEYKTIMKHIPFELGPIAYHCQEVYLEDPAYYDGYIPIAMLGASNDFYNYIVDSYPVFKREDGTSLKAAWEMYKTYNEEAKVSYPLSQRAFKEELKNYFHDYTERFSIPRSADA